TQSESDLRCLSFLTRRIQVEGQAVEKPRIVSVFRGRQPMTIEQTDFVASIKFIRHAELESQTIYVRACFEFFVRMQSAVIFQRGEAVERPMGADPIHSDPDAGASLIAEPLGRHQRTADRGGLGRTGGEAHAGDSVREEGCRRADYSSRG